MSLLFGFSFVLYFLKGGILDRKGLNHKKDMLWFLFHGLKKNKTNLVSRLVWFIPHSDGFDIPKEMILFSTDLLIILILNCASSLLQ